MTMLPKEKQRSDVSLDDVYKTLRQEILTLKLRPGEALTEQGIAARFHMSRTPVRSAFTMLAHDGLVDLQGRHGTFVSLIDVDHAAQIIYLRILVEAASMKYIARNPDFLLFANLENNLAEQDKVIVEEGTDEAFFKVDSKFHEMCAQSANKLDVWMMLHNLDVHYRRYRLLDYFAGRPTNILRTLQQEHALLYAAMRERRAQDLDYLLTSHLYGGIIRSSSLINGAFKDYLVTGRRSMEEITRDIRLQLNEFASK